MSDKDMNKKPVQESEKPVETAQVTPPVAEEKKPDKVETEKKKKGINISRILYLTVIIAFCVITVLYIVRFNNYYYNGPPPDTDDKMSQIPGILPYYTSFIIYPPRIVKDVGIGAFLFLITLYLCFDFILFEKLKGWKKALSVILSVLLIIAGTEFVMDFYANNDPVMNRPHPTLFWEVSPNIMTVRMGPGKVLSNSHGFRSPEITIKKPEGQYRVMILGDSSAFGHFVNNDQTFGAVLVKMLRQKYPGKDIRLINAAVLGYTTYQGATFMKERGWKYSPDLIIISFNDDPQIEWKQDVERVPSAAVLPVFRILYKSNIYLALKKHMLNERMKKDHSFAIQPGRIQEKNRVSPNQLKTNMAYMLDGAKKRNAQAIVISMPLQSAPYDIRSYREIMKESAISRGYYFLDLLDNWQKYPAHEVFLDIMHPTVKGHKIIAEDLFKIIEDNGIINKQGAGSKEP